MKLTVAQIGSGRDEARHGAKGLTPLPGGADMRGRGEVRYLPVHACVRGKLAGEMAVFEVEGKTESGRDTADTALFHNGHDAEISGGRLWFDPRRHGKILAGGEMEFRRIRRDNASGQTIE